MLTSAHHLKWFSLFIKSALRMSGHLPCLFMASQLQQRLKCDRTAWRELQAVLTLHPHRMVCLLSQWILGLLVLIKTLIDYTCLSPSVPEASAGDAIEHYYIVAFSSKDTLLYTQESQYQVNMVVSKSGVLEQPKYITNVQFMWLLVC